MKTLCLTLLLFLASLAHANAQSQEPANDLSIFLGKLQAYIACDPRHIKPDMPIAKPSPEDPPSKMPSPDVAGYMQDPKTGLRYYAKYDKIVDFETGYSFHVATMTIAREPVLDKSAAEHRP
ncbi:hypothetical protein MKJ04_10610 [Pontibacter sp. E15-1]|uniref:hypothetical protein n=1 Tax=Pontibacter sp. E15-1 TaxID=2919918 RepID=UPI001F4FED54|nr:hypothetical protein [Pontibacter sp. E15-1]MCJ8165295.1 hypothetical protein [Pontibacter sp. E15-1]